MFKLQSTEFDSNEFFYATPQSAGLDVRAAQSIMIAPHAVQLIPTGLKILEWDEQAIDNIEKKLGLNTNDVRLMPEIQIRPRSGLSLQKKLLLLNTPGTIDADYRGEIKIMFFNLNQETVQIEKGERIAQLICSLIIQLNYPKQTTTRGHGGSGSSGHN